MRMIVLVVCFALLASQAFAEDKIYKRVNKDGSIEFTDQPGEDSSAVNLPPTQLFKSGDLAKPSLQENPLPQESAVVPYQLLEILSPSSEASIHSAPGNITVSLALKPRLQKGHQLQILVDNLIVGQPQTNLQFSLKHLPPGTHELSAQVVDTDGSVLHTSANTRIYLHRPSLLRPNR